tara:strand:+ start:11939 stop:12286 length:348 start_codon:yes stop_codon:yes gene_type:complete
MKKIILIATVLITSISFAGPGKGHSHGHGHSHNAPEVSEAKTKEIARKHVERLVKDKKIDSSWSNAIYDKSEKKLFGGNTEWVVTYKNDKDPKNKTLYIFLKLSGEFVAANFSGK